MANFNQVSLAEISTRLPEQIFCPVKRAEKPHANGFKFQYGLKSELGLA